MLERWNFRTTAAASPGSALAFRRPNFRCRLPVCLQYAPTVCGGEPLGRAALPCADGDTGTAVAPPEVALAGPSHRLPEDRRRQRLGEKPARGPLSWAMRRFRFVLHRFRSLICLPVPLPRATRSLAHRMQHRVRSQPRR